MKGPTRERWIELCEQAAIEQDREKLLELTTEITRLLDATMNYYVLKKGNLFKILYMDEKTSPLWETEGWETLPCDSNEEAQKAMSEWKSSVFAKANVIPIRRDA
jgi:hypothetical protein